MAKILFWTEGDSKIGLGLVERMLVLARKLKSSHEIAFWVNANPHVVKKVRQAGFTHKCFMDINAVNGKQALLKRFRPDVVVTDIKHPEDCFFRNIKECVPTKIATFDELNRVKLCSDLVINYNTFDPRRRFESELSSTKYYFGPSYVILRDEFLAAKKPTLPGKRCHRIFVAFGGSDPLVLTPKVAKALSAIPGAIEIVFVLGAAFLHQREMRRALRGYPHVFRVLRDVKNISKHIRRSDLVITAGGTIMYESLFLRRPVITLCQAPHQNEFASQLHKRGAVLNLGLGDRVGGERIRRETERLMAGSGRRRRLVRRGSKVLDGKGAQRLVREISKMAEGS